MHMLRATIFTIVFSLISSIVSQGWTQVVAGGGTSGPQVDKMQQFSGFFDFYWDDQTGQIWLRLERFDSPFLYVNSLATGLGSNPVGLDRGQLGGERVVRFHRVANRVFLIHENLKYRATSAQEPERRAVRDSFAESVIWAGEIRKTSAGDVVDMTSLLLRDAHDCIGALKAAGQGTYRLETGRSFVHLPRTKSFPKNTEFEASLTFVSSSPGKLSNRVAADGGNVTLRQHHSFVELPDQNYSPRRFDPRAGGIFITYADYAAPIDGPLERRFITRHRLKKRDSNAARSVAVEPIIYYVDPGVPEPIRSALVEGAKWWSEAFDEAGFIDAFQVRILPDDADPMDVRYNVIQWVHRATRGWSYGGSVIDPRTGEIIKGHVSLGSLRVRQDRLLIEGLRSALHGATGRQSCCAGASPVASYLASFAPDQSSVELALARIRQLSAHEVGHTLGFSHNFAASTYGDRASVMDYPAPRTRIENGKLDLSDAYGVGVGIWDKFTVKYAYSEFPAAAEQSRLQELVDAAIRAKMLYISDADARPAGAAHPLANLWDNGEEPIASLRHEMAVRRIAIDGFDASAIAAGEPLAELEKTFVPVYLHHRYQVDAAAKIVGGVEYSYAVNGDGQVAVSPVSVARQRAALRELVSTLRPSELLIPHRVVALIPPKVYLSPSDRERFSSQTSPIFDPGSAMKNAATMTLANLLQPQRASRLASMQDGKWGLGKVIEEISSAAFAAPTEDSDRVRRAMRVVQTTAAEQLMRLVSSNDASSDARAIARNGLAAFAVSASIARRGLPKDSVDAAHLTQLVAEINRFTNRPHKPAREPSSVESPPGSPIGH